MSKLKAKYVIPFIIVLGIGYWLVGLYTDWLWFQNLGYESVFMISFLSRWGVRLAAWLLFFLFFYFNLSAAKKALLSLVDTQYREKIAGSLLERYLTPKKVGKFLLVVSLAIAFFFSANASSLWLPVQQFIQRGDFGLAEPIFNKDVSFYIFQLPLWRSIYTFLQTVVVLTLLCCAGIYYLTNPAVEVGRKLPLYLPERGQEHISLLLALFFLLKAWDYRLKMYELMTSTGGFTFGPGFAEVNANIPALWILFFLALATCGLLLFNMMRRQFRLIIISVALLLGASLIVGSIYPWAVQRFRVEPNQFAAERLYIEHNIGLTLYAYGLNNVREEIYPALEHLDWEGLDSERGSVDNIRLQDYRPLRQTYNQLQGIRPYYEFVDVDTDRYTVDEQYRQVLLSAREMNHTKLAVQAQTWQNLRLQYTHGYGMAMSPVARVTPEGLPTFIVGDIPAVIDGKGLEINRPEIYYGEIDNGYAVVNTSMREFSYPVGDTNAWIHYDGKGGVILDNFIKRAFFALKFGDYKLLLTKEITTESRIMFNRSIRNRAFLLAPFLRYDGDPYLVLADGRLFWILDAYTVTKNFPYSQPFDGINYVRNSVKVVIDAYQGSVDFYLIDDKDPVANTYARIFPALFKTRDDMPSYLYKHLRYPETFLDLQSRVFAIYHMTDPNVFYNQEDLWQIPNEKYAGSIQPVEPYYTILQLPREDEPEFVLIIPFTPARKDNMIAWMAGRCDGDNYGELLVYNFPKERVVFGPMQVETRIDQNTLISQQISLWDQRGSEVIRGNLLVLPINGSILYVEPVFLKAEQSELPELARVIVGFQEKIVMEPTLEQALISIFGPRGGPGAGTGTTESTGTATGDPETGSTGATSATDIVMPGTVVELAQKAQELYQQAQDRQRRGDWAGYGNTLNELERTLEELVRMSGNR